MNITIHPSWRAVMQHYFDSGKFDAIAECVGEQYLDKSKTVYPRPEKIFNAFELTPFDSAKVVIIGQDPYHGPGQATGLAFSVPKNMTVPPSLKNIYKEIISDTGQPSMCLPDGDLFSWAQQGVLLLNSVLTVESNNPASHTGIGWEDFTDEIIKQITRKKTGTVFLLWGAHAQKKGQQINREKNLVLESSHPSPLGAYRGFNGCKHFSQCNEYLIKIGKKPIVW